MPWPRSIASTHGPLATYCTASSTAISSCGRDEGEGDALVAGGDADPDQAGHGLAGEVGGGAQPGEEASSSSTASSSLKACRVWGIGSMRRLYPSPPVRPPGRTVEPAAQAPPAGSASSMISGLSRAVTIARHWSTNSAMWVPSLRWSTSTPRMPARAVAPAASVRRATW